MRLSNSFDVRDFSWLAPVSLCAAGAALFANGLQGALLFDDVSWSQQPHGFDAFGDLQSWLLTANEGPLRGRPLPAISLAINDVVGADRLAGYHTFNISVHISCAIVLYGLLRRTFERAPLKMQFGRASIGLAFCCSLVWMIHPLQTECVNYISQRTESMAAFFILLTLYSAIRAGDDRGPSRWWAIAMVSAWFAGLCKEIAMILPALVVLYDWAVKTSLWREELRRRAPLYVAICTCWIPVAAMMFVAPRVDTVGTLGAITPLLYAQNQCLIIPAYLKLVFWPHELNLDYGYPVVIAWSEVWPGAALIGLLLLATLALLRYRPPIGYLGAWLFLTLAPTSSIIPIVTEVGAERRMYLPLAAIVVFVVLTGWTLVRRITYGMVLKWRTPSAAQLARVIAAGTGAALVFAIALPLAGRTAARNLEYRDPLNLWWSSLQVGPHNPRAAYNVAVLCSERGDIEEAIGAYELMLLMSPRHADAHHQVAALYQRTRSYEQAIRHYRQAIAVEPHRVTSRKNLSWLLSTCAEEAFRNGSEARRLANELCETAPNHAIFLDNLAAAQAECGDFVSAAATAARAVDLARRQSIPELVNIIEARRALYDQGRAYRFPNVPSVPVPEIRHGRSTSTSETPPPTKGRNRRRPRLLSGIKNPSFDTASEAPRHR